MTAPEIPILKTDGANALPEPVASHAAGRFSDAGVLVLKDLFPPDWVAALHAAYLARYGDLDHRATGSHIKEVGDKRLMIALDVAGEFASPDVFGNPVALSIAHTLLGDDFIMGSYVAVTSMAGAAAQRLHVDQEGLFEDITLNANLPVYSVTLVIPLIGLNEVTGSTQFFPGTHRDPNTAEFADGKTPKGTAPDLDPGDAIMFDSRIRHGGMANRSDAPRPILYCTYQRAWYRDISNHSDMPAMVIDRDRLEKVDADYRWLVSWMLTGGR